MPFLTHTVYKEGVAGFGLNHNLPILGLIGHISLPKVEVNCFLHLVILYNMDASKEIATVLP